MGDSILKVYVKEKIFFNSKYVELDPSFCRAHLVKDPVLGETREVKVQLGGEDVPVVVKVQESVVHFALVDLFQRVEEGRGQGRISIGFIRGILRPRLVFLLVLQTQDVVLDEVPVGTHLRLLHQGHHQVREDGADVGHLYLAKEARFHSTDSRADRSLEVKFELFAEFRFAGRNSAGGGQKRGDHVGLRFNGRSAVFIVESISTIAVLVFQRVLGFGLLLGRGQSHRRENEEEDQA